jgi:hypothetical protein
MAKFLTTSGVTYNLERLMKEAGEKLYLVSPFLKINDRLRQLLEDRDRFKIDMRVVYGKAELQSEESTWLNSLSTLRLSYMLIRLTTVTTTSSTLLCLSGQRGNHELQT